MTFTDGQQAMVYKRVLATIYRNISPVERDALAELMVSAVREQTDYTPSALAPGETADRLAAIKENGVLRLGRLLTPAQTGDIHAFFARQPVYATHYVDKPAEAAPRQIEEVARTSHFAAYDGPTIARAPHLLELVNSAPFVELAEAFLGCMPTLLFLSCWWSFSEPGRPTTVTQRFHRDEDDFRFLTLFVFLTDVDEDTGPHVYIRHSHDLTTLGRALAMRQIEPKVAVPCFIGDGYNNNEAVASLPEDLTERINGPAGTAFFANTYGLHRGEFPRRSRRLMFSVRYGLTPLWHGAAHHIPLIPRRDCAFAIGGDVRSRYLNRLIVEQE